MENRPFQTTLKVKQSGAHLNGISVFSSVGLSHVGCVFSSDRFFRLRRRSLVWSRRRSTGCWRLSWGRCVWRRRTSVSLNWRLKWPRSGSEAFLPAAVKVPMPHIRTVRSSSRTPVWWGQTPQRFVIKSVFDRDVKQMVVRMFLCHQVGMVTIASCSDSVCISRMCFNEVYIIICRFMSGYESAFVFVFCRLMIRNHVNVW